MAKILTKVVLVKFSKIIKDTDTVQDIELQQDLAKTLEEVAQEMCGGNVIVETEILDE